MPSKKEILKKNKIVLTQNFNTLEEAFAFFDKDKNGKLSKKEIATLLKQAKINGFLRGIVSKKLIEAYDENGDDKINWQEFKQAVKKM